jgi:hypothetical protein
MCNRRLLQCSNAGRLLAMTCYPATFGSEPTMNARGVHKMKNPLDSLGQTIILGLVLTVIVAVLIPIVGG